MKKLNFLMFTVLLIGLVSCGDPNLPFDLDGSLNNNGAFLRINAVESAAFDLADLESAEYRMQVEYFDKENGGLMQNVEFFASYTSFEGTQIDETGPVMTLSPSDFTVGASGRPEATISVPFTTVINALGLSPGDVGVEDQFLIKWVINLTDGRSFTGENSSPDVTGGAFFQAPGQARVFTVQALDETEFTGTYRFTQRAAGPIAGFLFGETETFETTLSVNPDNTLNGRVFTAAPYPGAGSFNPVDVPITLGRTATVDSDDIGFGLTACAGGDGLAIGRATEDLEEIDANDDSQFVLVLRENIRFDCGAPAVTIVFDVEKL